jgi:predicted dehydrogenase
MTKPRLGFVGLGWIGRNRMNAVVQANVAEVCALYDAAPQAANAALQTAGNAAVFSSFDELLNHDLDGVVIATPNSLHAEQSIAALESDLAVFCQKPLGRTAREVQSIVATARKTNRLLGVDLSYTHVPAMRMVSSLVESGALGKIFAVDATFHNAYGPDKPWFYDYLLSGGGCVLDLGVHLIDLALTPLGFPKVSRVEGTLFCGGQLLAKGSEQVEDYGAGTIQLTDGTVITLSCSWNLHAGRDAKIELTFYGTGGGASLRNVNGSFYDFTAERFHGTETETLTARFDSQWEWGGLATIEWVKKLARANEFDPSVERVVTVAEIIDQIYGRNDA